MGDYVKVLIGGLVAVFTIFVVVASWQGIGLHSFRDPIVLEDSQKYCPNGRIDAFGNCYRGRIRSYYGRSFFSGTGK